MNSIKDPKRPLKVFLCYSKSDKVIARELYEFLIGIHIDAWLDEVKIIAGQDWKFEISKAVSESDLVVICFSKKFNKSGFRQKELLWALDKAMEKAEGEVYIIPARLEECDVPEKIKHLQWVNIFEKKDFDELRPVLSLRAHQVGAFSIDNVVSKIKVGEYAIQGDEKILSDLGLSDQIRVSLKENNIDKALMPISEQSNRKAKAEIVSMLAANFEKKHDLVSAVKLYSLAREIDSGKEVSGGAIIIGNKNLIDLDISGSENKKIIVGGADGNLKRDAVYSEIIVSSEKNIITIGNSKKRVNSYKKNKYTIFLNWIFYTLLIISVFIFLFFRITNGSFFSSSDFSNDEADILNQPTSITSIQIDITQTLTPTSNLNIPTTPFSITKEVDWSLSCISTLWKPYPPTLPVTVGADGCWREPVYTFFSNNGSIDFLAERNNGPNVTYGLFAPLPESGKVTFTIRLRELKNVDLLMGIFAQPDVSSQGLLMIMLNGGVDENVFIQKDPSNYVTIQGTQKIKQGNGYSITFIFDNLSARSIVNPAVFFTDSLSLPSEQKWLFLGYKGLRGAYRIEGTFLNFELTP